MDHRPLARRDVRLPDQPDHDGHHRGDAVLPAVHRQPLVEGSQDTVEPDDLQCRCLCGWGRPEQDRRCRVGSGSGVRAARNRQGHEFHDVVCDRDLHRQLQPLGVHQQDRAHADHRPDDDHPGADRRREPDRSGTAGSVHDLRHDHPAAARQAELDLLQRGLFLGAGAALLRHCRAAGEVGLDDCGFADALQTLGHFVTEAAMMKKYFMFASIAAVLALVSEAAVAGSFGEIKSYKEIVTGNGEASRAGGQGRGRHQRQSRDLLADLQEDRSRVGRGIGRRIECA